jgi:hypothetical protein
MSYFVLGVNEVSRGCERMNCTMQAFGLHGNKSFQSKIQCELAFLDIMAVVL